MKEENKKMYQADYKSPSLITHIIDHPEEIKKHEVFEHTDFEKSKDYFHILPHDESHGIRRKAIMKKYGPEIRKLMNKDPKLAYLAIFITLTQILISYFIKDQPWYIFFSVMYVVGATLNHTAQVLIHDLTHYTAFEGLLMNRLAAILICIPTALPSAITFGRYHQDHHYYLGTPIMDPDLPTEWEIKFFKTPFRKICFIFCLPLFYVFRPLSQAPKTPTFWEGINWIVILTFDFLIYNFFGGWALAYLLMSTWFSMGLHPAAMHVIAEHYEFVKGQESYNYYGIWNFFNINLGYHLEHHDFPSISALNLPKISKIAPEFYDRLPHHTSYFKVMWNYIFDDNIGAFSRIDVSENKIKKIE